jgi:hypothetical protein
VQLLQVPVNMLFSHGACQLHQNSLPKITTLESHIVFFSNATKRGHHPFASQAAAHTVLPEAGLVLRQRAGASPLPQLSSL